MFCTKVLGITGTPSTDICINAPPQAQVVLGLNCANSVWTVKPEGKPEHVGVA